MRQVAVVAVCFLMGASVASAADVYRWVDEQGRVHYSDRWVPGAQLVSVSGAPPSEADLARVAREREQLQQSNERITNQQAQQSAQRAVQQDLARVREQQCAEAKKRYQSAIEARRLYRTLENGERQYLTSQEIDALRLQTRLDVEQTCGSSAAR